MSKHKYEVSGVTVLEGYRFSGKCVASDIIKAIQLFYENGYSVWKIEKKEQVNCDEEIGIKSINMLGMYSATGKSHLNDSLYMKLYSELHVQSNTMFLIKMEEWSDMLGYVGVA